MKETELASEERRLANFLDFIGMGVEGPCLPASRLLSRTPV